MSCYAPYRTMGTPQGTMSCVVSTRMMRDRLRCYRPTPDLNLSSPLQDQCTRSRRDRRSLR